MQNTTYKKRLPSWLKRPLPAGRNFSSTDSIVKRFGLNTVCRSANCPNIGECWARGTATFMILGDTCTRNCKFCAVKKGKPLPPDPTEPKRVAQAARDMRLRHIVVTSVTRDDLPDEGAKYFAETIIETRNLLPNATIEVLTPDFHARSECLDLIIDAKPTIFNHNVETVRELSQFIRPQANYERSLSVLEYVRKKSSEVLTKSGLMVGLGETEEQIKSTIGDLAAVGVQIITIGQYLAPTKLHLPTQKYYPPDWFEELTQWAKENFNFLGFFAGPFVRSSYLADKLLDELKFVD